MSDAFFNWSVAFTLKAEGGFVNDPADPGGATNMGITIRTLKTWRLAHGKPEPTVQDVKALTQAEAAEIYKAAYWSTINADKFFDPVVALAVFDTCVLCGIDGASRVAQRAVSECAAPITIDGKLGPKSIAAINNLQRRPFMRAFCAQRDDRFLDLVTVTPTSAKFLSAWMQRSAKLKALTLTDVPVVPVVPVPTKDLA